MFFVAIWCHNLIKLLYTRPWHTRDVTKMAQTKSPKMKNPPPKKDQEIRKSENAHHKENTKEKKKQA